MELSWPVRDVVVSVRLCCFFSVVTLQGRVLAFLAKLEPPTTATPFSFYLGHLTTKNEPQRSY